jgi:hypothetical protein
MFKCQQCQQSASRPNKVVVERKMVNHGVSIGPRGGTGSQIVREIVICDACAGKVVEAPIERGEPVLATIGDIPKAPSGEFLSFEQLTEIVSAK